MRKLSLILISLLMVAVAGSAFAVTSSDILSKVKAAEAAVKDVRAEMGIESADKGSVSDMGSGYSDILKLQKGVISWKAPDMFRMDGYARGIKASFVQNGYKKLVLASMIRQTEDLTNKPGKRIDSLDFGFLSSKLWKDNAITVVSIAKNGIVQLKLDPKSGGQDKRHDFVWVDPKTLRVTKREKYTGDGKLRVRYAYSEFEVLAGKLPIATTSTLFGPTGDRLGTVAYSNVKANVGLADSFFSMSQR